MAPILATTTKSLADQHTIMIRTDATAGAAILSLALLTGIHSARAETLSFACEEQDAGAPAEMTAVYEGGQSGTLKLKASFGEIELPATMKTREREIEGIQLKATGIRAVGSATVIMPDRGAIETCIAAKTKPEQVGDEDIFSLLLESCRPEAPLSKSPIPVQVSVEIVMMHAEEAGQPPDVEVYVKRTYPEKSAVPGSTFAIESFPPPRCRMIDK
jgi:hypothetical protein